MMKRLLIILLFTSFKAYSQPGTWTWISGDSAENSPGVYGTQGMPSVSNHPPGNYEYGEWTDKQGNFWVYSAFVPYYNDLWKYSPLTNEWSWVKGNALPNQPPVYGVQGVPAPGNSPGKRLYTMATWVDTTGNLWLFGSDFRNDLWKYDISSNEWTWMSGDTFPMAPAIHGIQGVPGSLNKPGGREETSSSWVDTSNNLWLFGGYGIDDNYTTKMLNDLMKYDISTNEWTWMSGSNLGNGNGVYGTKGIPDPLNIPGARATHARWKDNQGNFWLMGGIRSFGLSALNDLWRYNPATNEWSWMSGVAVSNDQGNYQSNCVFDTTAMPRSRFEHRSTATDYCGNFWLFGGAAADSFYLNDLWVFDPVQVRWNWISGTNIPNQQGSYGSLGASAFSNMPPSRIGANAWWGQDNRFYIFGGSRSPWMSGLSDVWMFIPDSNCVEVCSVPAVAAFMAPDFICPGTCTDFINLSSGGTSFQWSFPGSSTPSSTDVSPTNICYPNPGSYDVQLIATNATGSDTLLLYNYVTVYPAPPPQGITQNGDTLFAIAGASSYQWYFNGSIITGATDYFYVATSGGDYNVVANDTNGCEVEAVIFNVLASAQAAVSSDSKQELVVFPNPADETLNVTGYELFGTAVEISVYNMLGEIVMAASLRPDGYRDPNSVPIAIGIRTVINVSSLQPGIYFFEISSLQNIFRTKFVKQ
jgi:hypothetical protein